MKRRSFLKNVSAFAVGVCVGISSSTKLLGSSKESLKTINIENDSIRLKERSYEFSFTPISYFDDGFETKIGFRVTNLHS